MRPVILACLLAACLAAGTSAVRAAEVVDFKAFLENPEKYDGKEIQLRGFLSLEDYGKALFLTQEDYAQGRFENSVPIVMPRNVLDIREAFHRTFVRVRAVYRHDCAKPEMFCSAHPGQGFLGPVQEIWGERLPENEKPVYRAPAIVTPWDTLTVSETEDPDHEEIVQLAYRFAQAVKEKDREAFLALFEKERRESVKADLDTESSRTNWLLFTGQYNYGKAFRNAAKLMIVPLRMRDDPLEPQVAAACYCLAEDCLSKLSSPLPSDAVVTGSFRDPYKCMPFYKGENGWALDPGFLLSTDEDLPYGNDLGVMMGKDKDRKEGESLAAYMYTHPLYGGSPFLTRLRERPRPRAVHAMQEGRLNLPVFYITPSRALWALERSGGEARIRRIETDDGAGG